MLEHPKKFYITTAIDYANARPHIGHALEKIQADVIARYHRVLGERVWFVTGTDEHGAKIVRAAKAEHKELRLFVDENSEKFKALKTVLGLSWDDFIRTSDQKRHWPGAQKIWNALLQKGDLYRKTYRGLYCVGHEAFVTEKDLVPKVSGQDSDQSGRVTYMCQDHQTEPEVIEEENWFFKLSKYQKELEDIIASDTLNIIPEGRKNEILSFIREGLTDVSFSRPAHDVSWGIPVPNDPESTMYVWCDALSNYVTAIGYGTNERNFETWWPADVHVIGKDILRFHAIIWPAILLSAGLELPKSIFVHGFITVDGQKMSKTIGNVIDPFALAQKYGQDPVRYFLLREIPSIEDGDFSYKKFEDRYNGDLANGLGNLVARVATIGEKLSPLLFDFQKDIEDSVKKELGARFREYEKYVQEFRFNEALAEIWKIISFADKYFNDYAPWKITDPKELQSVITNAGYLISAIANLLTPFLPETSEKIHTQIHIVGSTIAIKKGASLFPRLG